MEELKKKIEKLLLKVQRPSRYIGGEVGSVVKDKDKVDVRFAFCFPDTYEVGMSHLGMKILYGLKNARENWWCERVFMPEEDYNKLMRENDIPLYALESLDPIKDFDFIGFTLMYELSYNNVLEMLDLAGVPVLAGFTGGLAKFVGPTGGFLISFPLMAFVIGWGVEHRKAFPGAFVVALVAGTVLNYVVGVAMFCALTQSTLAAGITACVLPFIPTAIIKAILASVVGFAVRKRLN